MSLNIKTANGLQEIGKVTKEKIVTALGYEPAKNELETTFDSHVKDTDIHITADERTLWTETAENLDTHKSDKTAHITAAERQTWNDKSDVKSYNDLPDAPDILDDDSGKFSIADDNGNVIVQIDADGLETTKITAAAIELNGQDVDSRLDELEAISLPNILDNESGELAIADEDGNVVMKVNADGVETTTVTASTAIVNGINIEETLLTHTGDTDIHITAAERTNWDDKADKPYVQAAIADLVSSSPEALNTLNELAAALGNDPNFATTITNEIAKKANITDLDDHKNNKANPHEVTKTQVGLGNVDNTSDIDKPVSTAQQAALDELKSELSESIVSEAKEWIVADEAGNVIARVDADGLETTTVTAQSLMVDGTDIKATLDAVVDDHLIGTDKTELLNKITTEAATRQAEDKALSDRITSITNDYLKEQDKTALTELINTKANTTALKAEEERAIAAENGLAASIKGVTDDYLKAADKTELTGKINKNADDISNLTTRVSTAEDDIDDLERSVATKAEQSALEAMKDELSESIVSESKEFIVTDDNSNIVLRVGELDENYTGLETTNIRAQTAIIGDTDIKETLDEIVNDHLVDADKQALIQSINSEAATRKAADDSLDQRIKAITADYLKKADKTELTQAITQEVTDRKQAINGVDTRLNDIEEDYLTSKDKTALQESITTVSNAVELLTNGASAEEIDSVNDLIQYVNEHGPEVIEMQNDIAKNASDISNITSRVGTAENDISTLERTVANKAEQSALNNLRNELSESIVSEQDELVLIDENNNIGSRIGEDGITTTIVTADTVVAQSVQVSGIDIISYVDDSIASAITAALNASY